jgi:mono/diheme cytochrome c family protein
LRPGRARRSAAAAGLLAAAAAAFWIATAPGTLPASAIPAHQADLANGRTLFRAGSCLWCHQPAPEAKGADRALPSGGAPFKTPVGTFFPQNLTPDRETGIGRWSELDFVNAMARGVSPGGRHYFPAFPYPSFRLMRVEDLLDLRGYLMSLPAVRSPERPASLVLLPSPRLLPLARRGVGLWKLLGLRGSAAVATDPSRGASWNRGAYLVQAPGHCGECHTPRNLLMVPDAKRFLAGGRHPGGEGRVPSLLRLVARKRYKDAKDLALALQFGETYGYDKLSSGGMGQIQTNLAQLPESDLRAIADYLVSQE